MNTVLSIPSGVLIKWNDIFIDFETRHPDVSCRQYVRALQRMRKEKKASPLSAVEMDIASSIRESDEPLLIAELPNNQPLNNEGVVEIIDLTGFDEPHDIHSSRNQEINEPLDSPEVNMNDLHRNMLEPHEKNTAKNKRNLATKVAPPAKKIKRTPTRHHSTSSSSDEELCIVCGKEMPPKQTKSNSIGGNTCKKSAHLKCATFPNSYFTCLNCDSEYSD